MLRRRIHRTFVKRKKVKRVISQRQVYHRLMLYLSSLLKTRVTDKPLPESEVEGKLLSTISTLINEEVGYSSQLREKSGVPELSLCLQSSIAKCHLEHTRQGTPFSPSHASRTTTRIIDITKYTSPVTLIPNVLVIGEWSIDIPNLEKCSPVLCRSNSLTVGESVITATKLLSHFERSLREKLLLHHFARFIHALSSALRSSPVAKRNSCLQTQRCTHAQQLNPSLFYDAKSTTTKTTQTQH